MGYLEEKFFSQYVGVKPTLYLRYIDDIFGILPANHTEFLDFYQSYIDFHTSIKFTKEVGTTVTCLDIKLTLADDHIETTIYYKPTDSHSYLRYDSFHPEKCLNSIPYSQFLRLRRICSKDEDFLSEVEKMSSYFKKRGYPTHVLENARTRSSQITRDMLLEGSQTEKKTVIPLVLPFHPISKKINGIVHKNARFLSKDTIVGHLYRNNIVTAFRNPPNIGKTLIRSRLESDEIPGTFPCGRPCCKTCAHVINTDCVTGPSGSVTISRSFTCTSKGVIYALLCERCPQTVYIGETGQMLSERFRSHLFDIRHQSQRSEVARHFNSHLHSIENCLVTCLVSAPDRDYRRLRESTLIRKMGTLYPFGLNKEEDSSYR